MMKYIIASIISSVSVLFFLNSYQEDSSPTTVTVNHTCHQKVVEHHQVTQKSESKPSNSIESKEDQTTCPLPDPPKFTLKKLLALNDPVTDKAIELREVTNKKSALERREYRHIEYEQEMIQRQATHRLPRFDFSLSHPSDWEYYGIHIGDYKLVKNFLGVRECPHPALAKLNNKYRDDQLFLHINLNRSFYGRARIINDFDRAPIESNFSFERFPPDFNVKYYSFEKFNLSLKTRGRRKILYGEKNVSEREKSPWFFNQCSKGMSLGLNQCWLDQSYDMGLADFFYLTRFDLLVANIYCKKSDQKEWERIAYIEYVRNS